MNRISFHGFLLVAGCFGLLSACSSAEKKEVESESFDLKTHDLAKVADRPNGLEGPAVWDGILYFVNADRNGNICRLDLSTNEFSVLVESLPNGSFGNGIRFNKAGEMFVADYTNHNVLKVDPANGNVSVYAHEDGMNQPNDLAISSNGTLFASDPNWGEGTGNIWRIDTDGSVNLLESGMGTTNGIEVAPGDKIMYVAESVQRNVWAYDLSPEGAISNKRLHIKFEYFGMDGMRCDEKGNLYITRHGKGVIAMVSPAGELIREIQTTGKKTSNIAFGGKDGKTGYITLQDRGYIEAFEVPYKGKSQSGL
ncbi:MAG: SMP-30/gluconolactonase/LRE family protein [Bacteroidetes bacterium]|nr:SMP-30/gluconolactonase/LRE family protein [Bacteroidota bacterium]MDA1119980.1 SMP-30/gluconolactonase/LRE family protein [Bacteroidota bacterium]